MDESSSSENEPEPEFQMIKQAHIICKSATQEIIRIATKADTWIKEEPEMNSPKESLLVFQVGPATKMRVECSIENAIIPVTPRELISIMTDVHRWVSVFSHIIFRGHRLNLTGGLKHLSNFAPEMQDILMLAAEFHLPIPFTPTRSYCFLRFCSEVRHNVWAIVDVADSYFHFTSPLPSLNSNCLRRPSGLIIRKSGENDSQVLWIENIEAYDKYSLIDTKLAFSAKRWVTALSWKLNKKYTRCSSSFAATSSMRDYIPELQDFAYSMKISYINRIIRAADERKWRCLSDQEPRIHWEKNPSYPNTFSSMTSFHLQAKPLSVLQYLTGTNLKLEWHSLKWLTMPELEFRVASGDNSCCITVHKKGDGHLFQEAISDGFCSFVISAPMSPQDFRAAFHCSRWKEVALSPSGFTILPYGSGGLDSDASLVIIAMDTHYIPSNSEASQLMNNFIHSIVRDISNQFSMERDQIKASN